ncbi:DUF983 domain-containing protein [Litorimonas sp. RW-G-Af-16]|uniref:DUF983 domain-containing protein n=1 Tax=Litorimonas sp. RW-G-Af-16 TaxID=3241168 RepID=UPI00390C5AE0
MKLRTAIFRGMRGKCPNCGEGRLLKSYLTPVDHCANCGQPWAHVRAELGPAWASMTLAAHIVVPIYHFFIFDSPMPNWQQIGLLSLMAIGICLLALPRMKGLFMAIVWAKDTADS